MTSTLMAMTTTLSLDTDMPATWMMPGKREGMPRVSVPNSISATCPTTIIRPKPAMMFVRNWDSENLDLPEDGEVHQRAEQARRTCPPARRGRSSARPRWSRYHVMKAPST